MTYKRVLIKLSGGAFAGAGEFGFDRAALDQIGDEILAVRDLGVEVAIMVGGGNIFRGRTADDWGIERAEADNIGTMATVINSLILRGVLTAKGIPNVRVMTAIPTPSVAEPYIRLRAINHMEKGYLVIFAGGNGQPYVTTDYPSVQRAIEVRAEAIFAAKQGVKGVYTANPHKDATARLYRTASYTEILRTGVQVMDQSAFILARDYGLPIHVFDFAEQGAMRRICAGEHVGTLIGAELSTTLE
ncbi:MAG TPA: UMP kinase [Symbiobacteriaceae bacterium]|nr:UMP kinase [Symbiobacteriaceae bacterium]